MPTPKSASICLSQKQQTLLQQIVRRTTNPHRLVRRAKLILAAASGVSNAQISQQLQLDRGQVRLWRTRWLEGTSKLTAAEVEGVSDKDLSERISLLLDDPRPSRNCQLFQHRTGSTNCCARLRNSPNL